MEIGEGISGALFSEGNRYRYALWRKWEIGGDNLLFIGLNPSTANDVRDDPTIRRMINFAKGWGFSGLFVGNLFSIVSADPLVLHFATSVEFPDGPNDVAIKRMRELCTLVIVGWGVYAKKVSIKRPAAVLDLVGEPIYCLKTTKVGEPSHPLYLPANTKLSRYYRKTSLTGE